MKNITLRSLFKPLGLFFRKFHFTMFVVLVIAGLGGAVLLLNTVLSDLSGVEDGYTSSIDAGTIDQATLDRIKELHTSSETAPTSNLPSGRINPFGE